MTTVVAILSAITQVAYLVLAVIVFIQWRRRGGSQRGTLAAALGLLAISILLSVVRAAVHQPLTLVINVISTTAFMGSGFALLMFRNSLVPYRRFFLWGAAGVVIATEVLYLTASVPSGNHPTLSPYQTFAVYSLIAVWGLCVLEPVVRIWLASRGMPAIQRARARALSLGYGALLGIFVVAIGAAALGIGTTTPLLAIALALSGNAFVAILYASFLPPAWLRRLWRAREEDAFNAALKNLLLYSHDLPEIANRSVSWATRLLGAQSAILYNPDGTVLATQGISADEAAGIRGQLKADVGEFQVNLAGHRTVTAIVAALPLDAGAGRIAALSGNWTPVFGSEEQDRLVSYAAAVTAALERVRLVVGIRELNADLEARVLTRTAELEAANAELEAFSYSVSHDLRAPLRAISGFTNMISAEHAAELSPEGRRLFDLVTTNTTRMGQLIDDLLVFARVSRQQPQLVRVDFKALTHECFEALKTDVGDRHVRLEVGELPACMGDPSLLRQVVVNLLSNALKFTRSRRAAQIEVNFQPADEPGQVVYFVRDNGVGFDMQYKDQLFGVFHRLHPIDKYEGTGVGLAIVERIVSRMHGRVWAEAAVDEGATFFIQLQGTTG